MKKTKLALPRLGPIARISIGLAMLMLCLVLLGDLLLGWTGDRGKAEQRAQARIAENVAVQIASLIQDGHDGLVNRTLQQLMARDADIHLVRVRRADGTLLFERGSAKATSEPPLSVPVRSGATPWGQVEVQFGAPALQGWRAWLAQPELQLLLVLGLGGFALSYAYLRRVMHYLNPQASVPDRVRRAFDVLSEGLLVIDQHRRIVLANEAFRKLHPAAAGPLNGQHVEQLDAWLFAGQPGEVDAVAPWKQAGWGSVDADPQPMRVVRPDGTVVRLTVVGAPITDDLGRARGWMITFNDVTAVHRTNEELRRVLTDLHQSHEKIETQNEELRNLALRDPLTGSFNRRAFFDQGERALSKGRREGQSMSCIMADIDHFKQFNDSFGHAVGDQVIQVVAKLLSTGLRHGDILCRYGGEEFCLLLPNTTAAEAVVIAERLRTGIESHGRSSIRDVDVTAITSSFGVAQLDATLTGLPSLIDAADAALYRSKRSGRNRVTRYGAELEALP